MIRRQNLLRVKTRALRLNVWFKALSKTDRAIVDLTLSCVQEVRSRTLGAAISTVIDKLLSAFQNRFVSRADKVGRGMAEKLSEVAKKWGHTRASSWKSDRDFIRFLGVNLMNN